LKQPVKVRVEEVIGYLTPADHGVHPKNFEPPPDGWDWLGHIRQADGVWRAVALTGSLASCWDALLAYPGHGDLLCCPLQPVPRGREEPHA
jgi:hypothetical protein